MNEVSAAFEKSVEMQRVDVRTVDLLGTFSDRRANYPEKAQIGLFTVRPIRRER